jgi:hypothetical protein
MTRALVVGGMALTLAGGLPTALGFMQDPRRASFSYLFAFVCAFTVVLGALFLVLIGHAANAGWFVAIRRLVEHVIGILPLLALLFVPVVLSLRWLYPWARLSELPIEERGLILRVGWLGERAFVVRSMVYFAVFIGVGEALRGTSLRQDEDVPNAAMLRRRLITIAAGALPVVALTLTFASFDWIMSLEPSWYSDVYGVYVFAGGFVAALGLFGAMLVVARSRNALPPGVSTEHFHAVGRLELAMVVFWAYIAWSQLVLQWIADLPREVTFYLKRSAGGWEWFGLTLIAVHWAIPFFFLLSRAWKRRSVPFVAVSVWISVAHVLDVYYLVLPALTPRHLAFHWLDLSAFVCLTGACVAFAGWRAGGVNPYPAHDPRLEESIHYEAA